MCMDGPNFGEIAWQWNRGNCYKGSSVISWVAKRRTSQDQVQLEPDMTLCKDCLADEHDCHNRLKIALDKKPCRCTICLPF